MKPVTAVIIGAGARGNKYGYFALDFPDRFKVVGVAEPREVRRQRMKSQFKIPDENVFPDWEDFIKRNKFADVVIIATQDELHKAPAVACAVKGYHILLEKPMAVTEEDCREIVRVCKRNNIMLCVCFVLRYHSSNMKVKELIDSGDIGHVVNIQHTEQVGFIRYSHSFVRGHWRKEESSTFSLMSKSSHDVDLIRYWMGSNRCTHVSSFGSLNHFKKENQPVGAESRCLDCTVEDGCPYSAKKLYLNSQAFDSWPASLVSDIPDIEHVTDALKYGPYGRCVYECDNDVCDNQVVNFTFEGGKTVSFTMMAFTEGIDRQTKVYGTKGEIRYDGSGPVYVFDFNTQTTSVHETETSPPPEESQHFWGHGGGDYFLMDSFVRAVSTNDASQLRTGPDDALASHLLVFAAEKSRRENRVITINEDYTFQ